MKYQSTVDTNLGPIDVSLISGESDKEYKVVGKQIFKLLLKCYNYQQSLVLMQILIQTLFVTTGAKHILHRVSCKADPFAGWLTVCFAAANRYFWQVFWK